MGCLLHFVHDDMLHFVRDDAGSWAGSLSIPMAL
jgi:hypothetical protein